MHWPLVSRGRFEKLRRRKSELKGELKAARLELGTLALRLRGFEKELTRPARQESEPETTPAPKRFTTPMDSLGERFDEARKSGTPISKFRARAN